MKEHKSTYPNKCEIRYSSLYFACVLMACVLFIFGCNESLRMTLERSKAINVDKLVPDAVRIIQQALADDDPQIRTKAIEVVAETQRLELMPKVQRLLKDESVPVRFVAALAVGDLKYSLAEGQVIQLSKDENENVRIAAAYCLSRLGYADRIELIRKATASKDQTIRANAALLLGKNGDKDALNLLHRLRDKDPADKVKFLAVEAIATLGDERIYLRLWAMLISAYADVRVMGVKAMGKLGEAKAKDSVLTKLDEDIKGAITTKLSDDILEVRLVAAEQLGMLGYSIGEAEVLDVFTENLTARMDKQGIERVNVLAVLAIGQIGTPALTKFLPRLLRSKSKLVRIAAAKAVFQCVSGEYRGAQSSSAVKPPRMPRI